MHEQLSIVPEKALKRFPVGGTWTGRLTAALCIQSGYCVSRWFSTQWASVCAGSAGLQRQLCARRPLDVCPQPQRADPLPWEASPAPVDRSVSLSLSLMESSACRSWSGTEPGDSCLRASHIAGVVNFTCQVISLNCFGAQMKSQGRFCAAPAP